MFYEQVILSASGGFGEWNQSQELGGWGFESEQDLIDACRDGVSPLRMWELGAEDCPVEIEDIRGRIHNQRGRIFVVEADSANPCGPSYFAIWEKPTEEMSINP